MQHRGQRLRAGGHDLLAGRGGAGERHLVDPGAAQRARRSRRAPCTICSTGCSGTTSAKRVDQPLADGRGVLAGLEHDRVAGGERVRDRADRREDRVVPRADHADHAVRLVLQVAGELGAAAAGPRTRRGPSTRLALRGRPVHVLDRGEASRRSRRRRACRPRRASARPARSMRLASTARQRSSRLRAAVEAEPGPPGAAVAGPGDGGRHRRRRRRPGTGRPPRRWRGWSR